MTDERLDSEAHARGGFEPDRVDLRGYYVALGATALVILASVWVGAVVFPRIEHGVRKPIVLPMLRAKDIPEPHLQVDPPAELQAQRAAERARLSSYGFVDREHGFVHIPIEVAKRRLLERGLPMRPEAP
jgi:hypothetical protein